MICLCETWWPLCYSKTHKFRLILTFKIKMMRIYLLSQPRKQADKYNKSAHKVTIHSTTRHKNIIVLLQLGKHLSWMVWLPVLIILFADQFSSQAYKLHSKRGCTRS